MRSRSALPAGFARLSELSASVVSPGHRRRAAQASSCGFAPVPLLELLAHRRPQAACAVKANALSFAFGYGSLVEAGERRLHGHRTLVLHVESISDPRELDYHEPVRYCPPRSRPSPSPSGARQQSPGSSSPGNRGGPSQVAALLSWARVRPDHPRRSQPPLLRLLDRRRRAVPARDPVRDLDRGGTPPVPSC